MVVVRTALNQVKLGKSLASPASQLHMDGFQQVEHIQALFTELAVCSAAPPAR